MDHEHEWYYGMCMVEDCEETIGHIVTLPCGCCAEWVLD